MKFQVKGRCFTFDYSADGFGRGEGGVLGRGKNGQPPKLHVIHEVNFDNDMESNPIMCSYFLKRIGL